MTTHASFTIMNVAGKSFVPSDKVLQISVSTHLDNSGIVANSSITLTTDELRSLVKQLTKSLKEIDKKVTA